MGPVSGCTLKRTVLRGPCAVCGVGLNGVGILLTETDSELQNATMPHSETALVLGVSDGRRARTDRCSFSTPFANWEAIPFPLGWSRREPHILNLGEMHVAWNKWCSP